MRSLFLFIGILLEGFFLFCDQKKETKKSRCCEAADPALGLLAPRNPKVGSKNPKAKNCRNDCIFLNAFGPFSILTPSGPKSSTPFL